MSLHGQAAPDLGARRREGRRRRRTSAAVLGRTTDQEVAGSNPAERTSPLPGGGVLIVQEAFIDNEQRTSITALPRSLHMLLQTEGGFDCTVADCAGWLADAGFRDVYSAPLAKPDSIVVGDK